VRVPLHHRSGGAAWPTWMPASLGPHEGGDHSRWVETALNAAATGVIFSECIAAAAGTGTAGRGQNDREDVLLIPELHDSAI